MKKTPFLILVPFVAVVIVIGVAALLKLRSGVEGQSTNTSTKVSELPAGTRGTKSSKPSNSFGGVAPGVTVGGAASAQTTTDLNQAIQATSDETGLSEFSALDQEAKGL